MDSLQERVFGMLKELHARKQQLDRVIAALEALELGEEKPAVQEATLRGNQAKGSKGTTAGPRDTSA